jgi:hypothetical protein
MSKTVLILQNGFLVTVYERINGGLFNTPRKLDIQVMCYLSAYILRGRIVAGTRTFEFLSVRHFYYHPDSNRIYFRLQFKTKNHNFNDYIVTRGFEHIQPYSSSRVILFMNILEKRF